MLAFCFEPDIIDFHILKVKFNVVLRFGYLSILICPQKVDFIVITNNVKVRKLGANKQKTGGTRG